MIRRAYISAFVFIILFSVRPVWSQCIISGNFLIPEQGAVDVSINVFGLVNPSLDAPNQGLCGVRIKFRHSHIGDLALQLESPSGDVVQLVGPLTTGNPTNLASWDVTFIPCGQAPLPDPGFSPVWSNDDPWALIGSYTGSYHPYQACLESFTGNANGLWSLTASDGQPFDGGEIEEVELIFCEPSGQVCLECVPRGGSLQNDTFRQCINGPPIELNLNPIFPFGEAGSDYAYYYLVEHNRRVFDITDSFDNTGLNLGFYDICGISILNSDSLRIQFPPPNLTMQQYEAWLIANQICYELSMDCATLIVQDEIPPSFDIASFCQGDTLIWRGLDIFSPGQYQVRQPGGNGCMRMFNLSVTEVDLEPHITIDTQFNCQDRTAVLLGADLNFGSNVDFRWFTLDGDITSDTTQMSIRIMGSGNYSLITMRSLGPGQICSDTTQLTVIDDYQPPMISFFDDTITCIDDPVLATAFSTIPSATIIWRDALGVEDTAASHLVGREETFTAIAVTNRGCRDSIEVTLYHDTIPPRIAISDIMKTCYNDTALLHPSVADTSWAHYWVVPEGDTIRNDSIATTGIGLFTLISTAANGCKSLTTVNISASGPRPHFQIRADTFRCLTDSVEVHIQSNQNELSIAVNGRLGFSSNLHDFFLRDIDTFDISIVTQDGCQYDTVWIPFQDLSTVALDITADTLTCTRDSVQLIHNLNQVGLSFQWSEVRGFQSNLPSPYIDLPGTYILELTTRQGCLLIDSVLIELDTVKAVNQIFADTLSCSNDSVQINNDTQRSGDTYLWQGPLIFMSQSAAPWVQESGIYILSTTGLNGCIQQDSIRIRSDFQTPSFTLDSNGISCRRPLAEFTIHTNAASVLWTGIGISSMDTTVLLPTATPYAIDLMGVNGCDTSLMVTPAIDTSHPMIVLSTEDLGCHLDTVPLIVRSDLDLDSILWQGPGLIYNDVDSNAVDLPGVYVVEVMAQNGCSTTDSIEVMADFQIPDFQISGRDTINCQFDSACLIARSSMNDVTYIWNQTGGIVGRDSLFKTVHVGEVQLIAETANTCRDTAVIFIVADTARPVIQVTTDTINCVDTIGNLIVTTHPDESFIWVWPNQLMSINDSIETNLPGTYEVQIENLRNGCKDSTQVELLIDTAKVVNAISGDTLLDCAVDQLILRSDFIGSNVTYLWNGPSVNPIDLDSVVASVPGLYVLNTSADNGCFYLDSIFVAIDTIMPNLNLVGDSITCFQPTVLIQSMTDALNPDYAWTGPDGFISTDSTPTINTPGWYHLILTPENNCVVVDSIDIRADTADLIALLQAELLTCSDTTTTIQALSSSVIDSYDWQGPGGFMAQGQSIVVDTTGTYYFKATAPNGCMYLDTILIDQFDEIGVIRLLMDTITCTDLVADLAVEHQEINLSYSWLFGPSIIGMDSFISQSNGGSYQIEIMNASGCTWDSTFILRVDTFAPHLGIDQSSALKCQQLSTTLTANDERAEGTLSLTWQSQQGTLLSDTSLQLVDIQGPGLYHLIGSYNENGCADTTQSLVELEESELMINDWVVQQPNCLNGYMAFIDVAEILGASGPFRFSVDGGELQDQSLFSDLSLGIHQLAVVDSLGCSDTVFIEIFGNDPLFVRIERDTTLFLGQLIFIERIDNFNPQAINEILWVHDNQVICDTCENLLIQPFTSGIYSVIMRDTAGCEVRDSIFISILNSPLLYIPNAYSPNNDGINDGFGPFFGSNVRMVTSFEIYSRWGEKLHERRMMAPDDVNLFWDGSQSGSPIGPGLFVYSIEVELIDGSFHQFAGEAHLIR